MEKKQLAIVTLGCSKNIVDSENLATRLQSRYNVYFEDTTDAEIVILNTCGFIYDAKNEAIQEMMKFIELKKCGTIKKFFVMGCLSERYKKDLEDLVPEVDEYFGVNNLEEILDKLECGDIDQASIAKEPRMLSTIPHTAYIKIAEGCNRMCAFCAIPYIRGKYVSRPIEEIVDEVKTLSKNGTVEFIIVAQDISYYGKDLYGEFKLPELLEQLVAIEEVKWIRLHYAYPNNFPLKVLEIMRDNPKICKYLDIPLQHINDNVLTKMKRGHTKAETLELLKKIRTEIPEISLRTTMMVGFPGETEKAFEELVDFVKEARFDRLGVFTYSAEEGTFSFENYKDSISKKKKTERAEKIMEIQQDISLELNLGKIDKVFEVIIDSESDEFYFGRTQYDSPQVDCEVLLDKSENPNLEIGKFYNVEITDAEEFDLYGVVADKMNKMND